MGAAEHVQTTFKFHILHNAAFDLGFSAILFCIHRIGLVYANISRNLGMSVSIAVNIISETDCSFVKIIHWFNYVVHSQKTTENMTMKVKLLFSHSIRNQMLKTTLQSNVWVCIVFSIQQAPQLRTSLYTIKASVHACMSNMFRARSSAAGQRVFRMVNLTSDWSASVWRQNWAVA